MAGPANVLQVVINGVNNAGPAFRQVAIGAAAMGAAVTSALAAATIRAGQFERGLAEIGTLMDGDVRPAIASTRREIMDLSVQFGQTMGALTKARYDIVSAGFTDAADSAAVLRESARLAVAGVSTVSQTADLLTTAINGLGLQAADASYVADVLFQTVRKGKTTMNDLAASFGPVFATARVAKIEIDELGAVMATLTANGVATAEAATSLNALMRSIAAPTSEAAELMDAMGINLKAGLIPAIRSLASVGEDGLRALAQFIPQIEALKAAASAAADIERLTDNFAAMGESAGQVSRAVGMMSETLPFKIDQFKAALDNLVVTIGASFLPAAKRIVEGLTIAAFVIRFLAEDTDRAKEIWKTFVKELRESSPAFDAIAEAIGGIKAAMDRVAQSFKDAERFNKVLAEAQRLRDAGITPKRPGILGAFGMVDNAKLWEMAEAMVAMREAAEPKADTKTVIEQVIEDTRAAFPELSKMLEQLRTEMEGLVSPAGTTAAPVRGRIIMGAEDEKPKPFGPPSPSQEQIDRNVAATNRRTEREGKPDEQIAAVRQSIEELSKVTANDLLNVAFDVGSAFGNMFGDIANGFLGLREGPIMIGRAFKSMAAGIIDAMAQIVARMLAMRGLMAIFGGGFGGLLAKDGARVPTASDGYSVSGMAAAEYPPIILPGSPGLDRTPVLASGGELLVPRHRVNAAEKMLRKVQSSPRGAAAGGRIGRANVTLNVQANRPFRTTEQNKLRDSVIEGLARGGRYSV